jgi:hypothetical protein
MYWDSGFGKIYCVGIELGQFEAVGMCRAESVGEGLEIRRYQAQDVVLDEVLERKVRKSMA